MHFAVSAPQQQVLLLSSRAVQHQMHVLEQDNQVLQRLPPHHKHVVRVYLHVEPAVPT